MTTSVILGLRSGGLKFGSKSTFFARLNYAKVAIKVFRSLKVSLCQ
jgi:hypothetical protein